MRRLDARLTAKHERVLQRQHARIDALRKVLDLTVCFQFLAPGGEQDVSLCLIQKFDRFFGTFDKNGILRRIRTRRAAAASAPHRSRAHARAMLFVIDAA